MSAIVTVQTSVPCMGRNGIRNAGVSQVDEICVTKNLIHSLERRANLYDLRFGFNVTIIVANELTFKVPN